MKHTLKIFFITVCLIVASIPVGILVGLSKSPVVEGLITSLLTLITSLIVIKPLFEKGKTNVSLSSFLYIAIVNISIVFGSLLGLRLRITPIYVETEVLNRYSEVDSTLILKLDSIGISTYLKSSYDHSINRPSGLGVELYGNKSTLPTFCDYYPIMQKDRKRNGKYGNKKSILSELSTKNDNLSLIWKALVKNSDNDSTACETYKTMDIIYAKLCTQ